MNIVGIIPARMASTRFPNKPLAKINGIPMVGHVYYRSKMSRNLNEVYIATCDEAIKSYAASIGAPCIMTADSHERASDRTAEAVVKIEQVRGKKIDVAMMVQGDEPMLDPEMLDQCLAPMVADTSIAVSNLMAVIQMQKDFEDSNVVKVVVDLKQNALYFSREPIPSQKKGGNGFPKFKQLGIIAFHRDALLQFSTLTPTPLEIIESVDMLRFLEHGYRIRMILADFVSVGVDTPEDAERVSKLMKTDRLVSRYAHAIG